MADQHSRPGRVNPVTAPARAHPSEIERSHFEDQTEEQKQLHLPNAAKRTHKSAHAGTAVRGGAKISVGTTGRAAMRRDTAGLRPQSMLVNSSRLFVRLKLPRGKEGKLWCGVFAPFGNGRRDRFGVVWLDAGRDNH